jgi:hypothetical protein
VYREWSAGTMRSFMGLINLTSVASELKFEPDLISAGPDLTIAANQEGDRPNLTANQT